MKIIFDHQIFSLQKYGGISRYVTELATNISKVSTHSVEVQASIHINAYLPEVTNKDEIRLKIPSLFGVGRFIALGVNTVFACLRKMIIRDVNIYHETYFSSFDCCPVGAKRIITAHDMTYELFDETPQRKSLKSIKSKAIKRADHIICVSENTRKDVIRLLGIPANKTSVVYLGYSLITNDIVDYLPASETPFILYVGHRGGYKNFSALLQAYSNSSMLKKKYKIVCFGGGKLSDKEIYEIESLQLPISCVTVISGNDNLLATLYSTATVFVYPSLYEGFGIPPLESMSFGCPVVCSNSSSLPEVVGDAAAMFEPTCNGELQLAIERVILEPEYTESLIAKGKERIKQFSWEKCATETIKVYAKVLEG